MMVKMLPYLAAIALSSVLVPATMDPVTDEGPPLEIRDRKAAPQRRVPDVRTEWGDLTAKFVYDGKPPERRLLNLGGRALGIGVPMFDESLIVNPENRGVENVAAWMYLKADEPPPPIHRDYEASELTPVFLDLRALRFDPHIVLMRTTQNLVASNRDNFGYNLNITLFNNPSENRNLPAGQRTTLRFQKPERNTSLATCNIHPWMKGHIVIRDLPYMAVSDKDGKLTIKNIPTGKRTFQIWHEVRGYVQPAVQNGEKVTWERGRVTVEIKPGPNDLGEIRIAPETFKK